MNDQRPTHCHYCHRPDPSGESLARLVVDVGLSMSSGRRTFTIDYCRATRVCRQEAYKYADAICDGEVEERYTSSRDAAQDVHDQQT